MFATDFIFSSIVHRVSKYFFIGDVICCGASLLPCITMARNNLPLKVVHQSKNGFFYLNESVEQVETEFSE